MKRSSAGLIAIGFAMASMAAVEAPKPLVPDAQSAAPAARPGMFAASSAPFTKRLSAGQREEWRFLKEAAAWGRFEQDSARLALAKSPNPQVRSIASMLLDHHAGAQPALQRMLHARNMAAPMLSNEQRKALNRLGRLQGAKFDREWLDIVALRSQQESLGVFERAAPLARDPQLRAWIERTTPTLRYHLATAERAAGGDTKVAKLPAHIATRGMGAAPAPGAGNLGEGNMLLVRRTTVSASAER